MQNVNASIKNCAPTSFTRLQRRMDQTNPPTVRREIDGSPKSEDTIRHYFDSVSVASINNNWTAKNSKTVEDWKEDLSMAGYAYDYAISRYRKQERKYSIAQLIISVILTTVSSSQLNLNEDEHPELVLTLKIGFALLSLTTMIISGIQKIKNYSGLIEKYRTYVDDMESFITILSSELMLPDNLREDALKFIIDNRSTFQKLISSAPEIDEQLYRNGVDRYIQFTSSVDSKYNRRGKLERQGTIELVNVV